MPLTVVAATPPLVPPFARVYLASPFTVPSGVQTRVAFSAVDRDTHGMWSASAPYALTAERDGNFYVVAQSSWGVSLPQAVFIFGPGGGRWWHQSIRGGAVSNALQAVGPVRLRKGEWVEMWVLQDSGANQDLAAGLQDTSFSVLFVGIL